MASEKLQLKGSFILLLSTVFFGSYGVWARLIGNSLDNLYQVWTRCVVILLILIPIGFLTKQIKPINKIDLKWIAFYTGAGAFTVAPLFYAFNVIGIGSATLLGYATLTIVTYIAGVFSFNEKMDFVKIVSLILALIGLYFVFSFSLSSHTIMAALAAVLSGAAGGIEVTFTKKVSDKYSAIELSILSWAVILVSHFFLSRLLGENWISVSLTTPWFAVVGFAIASISAFSLAIYGFKFSEPSIGAIVGLLEILFGIVFGVILFHESLTMSTILGAGFIFLSAALPNLKNIISFQRPQYFFKKIKRILDAARFAARRARMTTF